MGGSMCRQAPRGVVSGGYPSPTGGRVWGEGSLTRKFVVFFVENAIF